MLNKLNGNDEMRSTLVWCENTSHGDKPHELTGNAPYGDGRTDPNACSYPHDATVPEGVNRPIGHPYTPHD